LSRILNISYDNELEENDPTPLTDLAAGPILPVLQEQALPEEKSS
jgi:hypothetical protein